MFKFPHTRYVTTLVAGKKSPEAILEDLKKVDLNFPLPGVQEIYENLKDQQPDYFKNSKASILKGEDIKSIFFCFENFINSFHSSKLKDVLLK